MLLLSAACAGASKAPSPPAATALVSASDSARCAGVTDSLLALPPEQLPLARPVGRPRPPRPPRDAVGGVPVWTRFIVRPDGTADTATVLVEGTQDLNYRRAMVRLLTRERFEVPTVQGCLVWGRGDIMVVGIPVTRVRPYQ